VDMEGFEWDEETRDLCAEIQRNIRLLTREHQARKLIQRALEIVDSIDRIYPYGKEEVQTVGYLEWALRQKLMEVLALISAEYDSFAVCPKFSARRATSRPLASDPRSVCGVARKANGPSVWSTRSEQSLNLSIARLSTDSRRFPKREVRKSLIVHSRLRWAKPPFPAQPICRSVYSGVPGNQIGPGAVSFAGRFVLVPRAFAGKIENHFSASCGVVISR